MRELKPLATSDILDATFQIYRKHFLDLFTVCLVAYCIYFVVNIAVYFAFRGAFEQALVQMKAGDKAAMAAVGLSYGISFIAGLFSSMVALTLAYSVCTYIVRQIYLDIEKAPVGELFKQALGRFLPLVWTYIVFAVCAIVPFLPLIAATPVVVVAGMVGGELPALILFLLAALASFVFYLIYIFRRFLFIQIVILENRSGLSALRRARELVHYSAGPGFWNKGETRAAIVLLVMMIVSGVGGSSAALPKAILAAIYGYQSGLQQAGPDVDPLGQLGMLAIPPVWMVILSLIEVVGSAVFLPIAIICYVLFYYEQRVRGESFDKEFAAAYAQEGAAPAETGSAEA